MKTYLVLTVLTGLLLWTAFQTGAIGPFAKDGQPDAEQSCCPPAATDSGATVDGRCANCPGTCSESGSGSCENCPGSGSGEKSESCANCPGTCSESGSGSCENCPGTCSESGSGSCENCPGTCSESGSGSCQNSATPCNGDCAVSPSSRAMALVATAAASTGAATGATHQEPDQGDWSMWGGTTDRNMVSPAQNINPEFNLREGTHVDWTATLGSQTYGNAIVAGGKVLVGTNNGGGYRQDKYPADQDKGVVLCFDENTGEFLWQLTRDKLTIGRVCDWPLQGICSTPTVEPGPDGKDGWRMWVVTNRGELMCLDMEGMKNGNDGPYMEEVDTTDQDADILWNLDMINELGVFPHNLATSSPLVVGDKVYVLTSNGVDEAHLELPAPRAPSMLCVDKNTGEVIWEQNYPLDMVLHGQWSSPTLGEVNGQQQIYFPAGDGWLYALNADTGEIIWKFDMNPKDTTWELGGLGSRNAVISTAVFHDNKVIVGVGQDPEHGEGVGHLWCIDATGTGDISPELGEIGEPGTPNPDSGVVWHYGGIDETGDITGEPGSTVFRRTISTAAIHDGMVFVPDLSGFVHCVDLKTGKRLWEHDLLTAIWGSPMVVSGMVFLGVEDGKLYVYEANGEEPVVMHEYDTVNYSSVYTTPTIANGRMFITDRTRLYAVDVDPDDEQK